MSPFIDRSNRHTNRKASTEPEDAGAITEASLRKRLCAYAAAAEGTKKRWRKLRVKLIQKAAVG